MQQYMQMIRFFLILFLSLSTSAMAFDSKDEINAKISYIVMDGKTGRILDGRNPHDYKHPASLTKVMTLYYLFSRLQSGDLSNGTKMIVSKNAASQPPSKLGLPSGSHITVSEAIDALIIKSANDVATVVSEYFAKNEKEFGHLISNHANKLGLVRTNFVNASGLHDKDNHTTAFDMAMLTHMIKKDFAKYYPLFNRLTFVFRGKTINGHNTLLKNKGIKGLKTGYTDASGYNIITTFEHNNKELIVVVLGADSARSRDKLVINLIHRNFKRAVSSQGSSFSMN